MKRSSFVLAAFVLAPLGVLVACGSDEGGGATTPPTTSTPEAGGVDTGTTTPPTVDASADTGTVDSGTDTGVQDTGVDAPPPTYSIGGTIVNLTGAGLVLQNNAKDDLAVTAPATGFVFSTKLLDAADYAVTVKTQPANQTCKVTAGGGKVAGANVTSVVVDCANKSSCKTIHDEFPNLPSGTYQVDPDGAAGPIVPFNAYCDMDFDDGNGKGGWTLIVSSFNKGGPSTSVVGVVAPGSNASMPPDIAKVIANMSSQVHVRSTGKAATESITSKPNNEIIANLKNLLVLNEGLYLQPAQTQVDLWTGPFATAQYVSFSCATTTALYPDIFWACNNTTGLHLVGPYSVWDWADADTSFNIDMEAYVR